MLHNLHACCDLLLNACLLLATHNIPLLACCWLRNTSHCCSTDTFSGNQQQLNNILQPAASGKQHIAACVNNALRLARHSVVTVLPSALLIKAPSHCLLQASNSAGVTFPGALHAQLDCPKNTQNTHKRLKTTKARLVTCRVTVNAQNAKEVPKTYRLKLSSQVPCW
jgi:hypothetical protein